MVNVLKRFFTNDRHILYLSQCFQHGQIIPTNKTDWNGRKRSQTHTYEPQKDGWRTHTTGNDFCLRSYSQVHISWRRGLFLCVWGGLKYDTEISKVFNNLNFNIIKIKNSVIWQPSTLFKYHYFSFSSINN